MAVSKSVRASKKRKINKDNRRTAILVLGMHRSGTSALARVLNLLGCDLPKTLMDASPSNEAGHWESNAIYRLNDRILESAGSAWNDWLELNPNWFESPKAEEFREKAVATIADEFGSSRLFVVKDPRNCRLLPFWLDVFDRSNIKPLVFLPVRNPLEVAASLERRNGFDPALGNLLWLRHVLEAEFASRGIPRVFATYDQLMQTWGSVAHNAQKKLGVHWPRLSDRSASEIEAFLSNKLRHHKEPAESVLDNPTLSVWLRETYAIMEKWSRSGEAAADRAALDAIRTAFNAAAPAFGRLVASGQATRERAEKLEKRLIEEASKLSAAQVTSIEGQQKIDTLLQELEAAKSRAMNAETRVAELKIELDEKLKLFQASEAARTEIYTRCETAERRASELSHSLAQTKSALSQRSLEAEETALAVRSAGEELKLAAALQDNNEKVIADLQRHVSLLMVDVKERRAAEESLGLLRVELAAENDRQRRRDEELESLIRELADTKTEAEADLAKVRNELADTKAEAEADLAKVRNELADTKAEAELELRKLRKELAVLRADGEARHVKSNAEAGVLKAEIVKLRSEKTAVEIQRASEQESFSRQIKEHLGEVANLRGLISQVEVKVRGKDLAIVGMRESLANEMGRVISVLLDGSVWSFMPARRRVKRQMELLQRSGLFDAEWYLANNKDVADAGFDPLRHYVTHGALEGREPNSTLANFRKRSENLD